MDYFCSHAESYDMHPCLRPIHGENTPFEGAVVIPAIASIEVSNLGIISNAVMAFPNRVTLISTARPPRALGTTTLVYRCA